MSLYLSIVILNHTTKEHYVIPNACRIRRPIPLHTKPNFNNIANISGRFVGQRKAWAERVYGAVRLRNVKEIRLWRTQTDVFISNSCSVHTSFSSGPFVSRCERRMKKGVETLRISVWKVDVIRFLGSSLNTWPFLQILAPHIQDF